MEAVVVRLFCRPSRGAPNPPRRAFRLGCQGAGADGVSGSGVPKRRGNSPVVGLCSAAGLKRSVLPRSGLQPANRRRSWATLGRVSDGVNLAIPSASAAITSQIGIAAKPAPRWAWARPWPCFHPIRQARAVANGASPRTVCPPSPSRGCRLPRRRWARFGVAPLEPRISSERRQSAPLSAIFQAAGNSAGNSGPLRHTSKHACASQGEAAAARMRRGAIVGASLAPEQR